MIQIFQKQVKLFKYLIFLIFHSYFKFFIFLISRIKTFFKNIFINYICLNSISLLTNLEQITLKTSQDNNFSNNLPFPNIILNTNTNPNNKILLENSNFPQYQLSHNLNLQNFPNNLHDKINNLLNYNNFNQNLNSGNFNNFYFQKTFNGKTNLLQNLSNYLNLKSQINNQIHLNQNQIYLNQNHLYLNNHPGISNNLYQPQNHFNPLLLNNNQNCLTGLNLDQNSLNNLSQNNNIYLNEANFNSAYKIEKKNNEDIQFNLLNDNGRKIIIKTEVN